MTQLDPTYEGEFEQVRFCGECSSDNIERHPDEWGWMDTTQDWFICRSCGNEFQVWESDTRLELVPV